MNTHRMLLVLIAVAALAMAAPARAQTCGPSTPFPQCDGTCPPGLLCADAGGGLCGCVPEGGYPPCGGPPFGAPMCYGTCPPATPVCVATGTGCACVPTLSEWGIMGMSLVMLSGVLWLRRRRESPRVGVGSRIA